MAREAILEAAAVVTAAELTEVTLGTSFTLMGVRAAIETSDWSGFVFFVICPDAPTGTTPTLDVKVEHSPDGLNWVTLATLPQITAAGTYAVSVPGPGTSDAKTFALFVRAVGKVGGTTPVFPNSTVAFSPRTR